jgi:hypothetical protein
MADETLQYRAADDRDKWQLPMGRQRNSDDPAAAQAVYELGKIFVFAPSDGELPRLLHILVEDFEQSLARAQRNLPMSAVY